MSVLSCVGFKAGGENLIKNDKITLKSSPSQSTSNTITLPVVTSNEEIAIKSQVASLSSNNTFTGTNTFQNTITAQSFASTQDTLVRNSKVKINSASSQSNIYTATLPVMTADDTIALTSQIPSLTNVAKLDSTNLFTGQNIFSHATLPTVVKNLKWDESNQIIIGVNQVKQLTPSDSYLLTEKGTIEEIQKCPTLSGNNVMTGLNTFSVLKTGAITNSAGALLTIPASVEDGEFITSTTTPQRIRGVCHYGSTLTQNLVYPVNQPGTYQFSITRVVGGSWIEIFNILPSYDCGIYIIIEGVFHYDTNVCNYLYQAVLKRINGVTSTNMLTNSIWPASPVFLAYDSIGWRFSAVSTVVPYAVNITLSVKVIVTI